MTLIPIFYRTITNRVDWGVTFCDEWGDEIQVSEQEGPHRASFDEDPDYGDPPDSSDDWRLE